MQNILESGIYCIENIVNNKKYIGQSTDIKDRWRRHVGELNNNKHHNSHLQYAWNKYGESNFVFYVIEYCEAEILNEKEIYYINLHETRDDDYGYNLQSGGQGYNTHAEESKKKISESNKKFYAEHPEYRREKSMQALNQWANPKIKEKIIGENNGMYGKKHTEEAKLKMGLAQKGKVSQHRNITPVFCVELNKVFIDAVTACG